MRRVSTPELHAEKDQRVLFGVDPVGAHPALALFGVRFRDRVEHPLESGYPGRVPQHGRQSCLTQLPVPGVARAHDARRLAVDVGEAFGVGAEEQVFVFGTGGGDS